jgi:hypothetical protein
MGILNPDEVYNEFPERASEEIEFIFTLTASL